MEQASDGSEGTVVWVGVGAVGLLYAARLIRAGVHVHLLMRSGGDEARRFGIRVRSVDGDFAVGMGDGGGFTVHETPETLPPADLVLISTKTTANPELPGVLRGAVRAGTKLLTLQNGMGNEAMLAGAFPQASVYGGTAFVSVHRIGPATADHQHSGHLHIGRYGGRPDEGLEGVAAVLRRTGFAVTVMEDLTRGRWEKQLWNVPFNGLGAAMLADTQRLLSTAAGEGLVRAVMGEVLDVASADGHELPADLIERKIAYTRTMGAYRTSMQLDREAGRAMEVDAIVGWVARRGAELGRSVPAINYLQKQLQAVDIGSVRMT